MLKVTRTREEIIQYARTLAHIAKDVFERAPHKTHTIYINGDFQSGKSLLVDAFRAALFAQHNVDEDIPRNFATYTGQIGNQTADITLINAYGSGASYCPFSELDIAIGRQPHKNPGFIFILNRPPDNLGNVFKAYPLPPVLMNISVKFPGNKTPSWQEQYFGIRPPVPNTWERDISCVMNTNPLL